MTTVSARSFASKNNAMSRADYARFQPLVRRIAKRLSRRLPSHIELDDLMGLGWVGLTEAFSRSPVTMRAEDFEIYASKRVRGAMLDYVRALDPNARAARNASRRMARAGSDGAQPKEAAPPVQRLVMVDIDGVNPAADEASPDEIVARGMLAKKVAAAIELLPERDQQILSLYYSEGCTMREIGSIIGVTESRVSQVVTEIVKNLRATVIDNAA